MHVGNWSDKSRRKQVSLSRGLLTVDNNNMAAEIQSDTDARYTSPNPADI